MAQCRIIRTAQGYNVKASNGANSLLYADLLEKTRDAELAKDLYVLSETPQFVQNVTLPTVQSEATKTVIEYNGTKVHLKQHTNPFTNRPTGMLELDLISTPEEKRGQGNAKVALQQALDYADSVQRDVILTVAPRDKGTTEQGLKKFYGDFGFREFEFDFQMLRRKKATTDRKTYPFFDQNGEVKAQYVLQYAQNQNVSKEPLNFNEQLEVQNLMAIAGISNSGQLYETLKQAFYNDGMFSPTEASLIESGLYSSYEARRIIGDPSLLHSVQDAIERLKNTPIIENEVQEVPQEYLKKTTTTNLLGKLGTNNPLLHQSELIQEFGGQKDIENPELTESQIQDLSEYKRMPRLKDDLSPDVQTVIKPNATQVVDNVSLIEDISFLQNLAPEVQQTDEAVDFLATLEKNFAKYGIDIVGLRNFPNYVEVLQPLKEMAVNPTAENIANFEQAYQKVFGVELAQKEEIQRGLQEDATLVYSETDLSELELYKREGFIRTDNPNVLRKVQKLSNEELRGIAQGMMTEDIQEFINREIVKVPNEDVLLQKVIFGYGEAPQKEVRPNFESKMEAFEGNAEYLINEFPSKFWATALQEKEKQSERYRDFYSNFDIGEQGIYLLNDDAITVQKIKSYLNSNEVRDSVDIQQYSLLSQVLPNFGTERAQENAEIDTKEQKRVRIVNGQIEAERPNKPFKQLAPNVVAVKEGAQEFIRTPQGIFELQETQGGVSYYGKLQPQTEKGFYNFNPQAPEYINTSDYAQNATTKENSYKKIKRLYTKKESETIMSENFDCA